MAVAIDLLLTQLGSLVVLRRKQNHFKRCVGNNLNTGTYVPLDILTSGKHIEWKRTELLAS